MKRFTLTRDNDETGVSGTGVVAEGVLFEGGGVVVKWLSKYSSLVIWDSMEDFEAVSVTLHPNNSSKINWLDD